MDGCVDHSADFSYQNKSNNANNLYANKLLKSIDMVS